MCDYSAEEQSLLRHATRVFFPTPRYAYLFKALNIPTFPAYTTYRFQHSRVLQQVLFAYWSMPHPFTRIYFGKGQKATIAKTFPFPFLAMGPRVALHKPYLVDDPAGLEQSACSYNPLIIQESVAWTERVRVLCVHADCVGTLRQTSAVSPDSPYQPVPMEQSDLQMVLHLTRDFIRSFNLDDMVLEWGYGNGQWKLLEMVRPPVRWAMPEGILNRHDYVCELVQRGRL